MPGSKTREELEQILERDKRYDLGAYQFVLEALSYKQEQLSHGKPGHISGSDLLEGIKELGLISFGPLGGMVLKCWGIEETEDVSNIVFHLIDAGLMGKRESDTREDFQDGFDMERVFWEEYRDEPLYAGESTRSPIETP